MPLNIKKTKVVTTEQTCNLNIDNEDIKSFKDFAYLGSVVNSNGDFPHPPPQNKQKAKTQTGNNGRIREDHHELRCALRNQTIIIHTLLLSITVHKCEIWTVKKVVRKTIGSIEIWCWLRVLWVSQTARKINKWVIEQIKPETSLEANVTKQKLSYFRHIMRREDSLENTIILGKIESSSER